MDPFSAGHLGELTRIVSFDLVDAAISAAGATQKRLRRLPTRVVVYVLLAGVLFADVGYRQVLRRLAAGADLSIRVPGSSALSQAFRRIGVGPLRELFDLVRGPAAGAARWRGLLVCAIDGTTMCVPDTDVNAAAFGRATGRPDAPGGYPMLRLVSILACGSRTLIDAVFGSYRVGETTYASRLARCLRPGTVLLGDRNFAAAALIEQFAATGADLLIRCKDNRRFALVDRLGDGTRIAVLGGIRVRIIDAQIIVDLKDSGTQRTGTYRLITTLTNPQRYPAREIVELYHQRWEIETGFRETKSTILDGRVLRARTPAGIAQEVYAVLIVHQALRTAIADASLAHGGIAPDRLSFTIALTTARDTIHRAADVLAEAGTDLTGRIGAAVLDTVLPARRARSSPRVTKRAISKHRAKGPIDRTNYQTRITTHLLPTLDPSQDP
ncbi:MAG: IS4 family transposase [Nocardioides sp.]|uniref:IS4 family transposase n=1 Tax=Nocardioides sp. TaxID=35761 RepID=UPI0039E23465